MPNILICLVKKVSLKGKGIVFRCSIALLATAFEHAEPFDDCMRRCFEKHRRTSSWNRLLILLLGTVCACMRADTNYGNRPGLASYTRLHSGIHLPRITIEIDLASTTIIDSYVSKMHSRSAANTGCWIQHIRSGFTGSGPVIVGDV